MATFFILSDIIRYDDVETGRLKLIVGNRQKTWKATWLSNLNCQTSDGRSLPRKSLQILFKANELWAECPMLRLNPRTKMWIVPLKAANWLDFGVDLYLCAESEELKPLPRKDYLQFVEAVTYFNVTHLAVEQPRQTLQQCFLQHEAGVLQDTNTWEFIN